ncbi:hypothetical protein RRG08_042603 [Elysia crispata]|uniref:SCP domain-containing protein n=1 Tax=Elysia crispata TaxID=231223 RepID=A0AAE0XQC4_9GAST|nr:hypothetical protein RRG08_042603 [Elysia crispata]
MTEFLMARTIKLFALFFILAVVSAQKDEGSSLTNEAFLNADSGSGAGEIDGQPEISTCTAEFAREPDHTMCLMDDNRVLNTGVSERQKKVIIDYHNKVRRTVQPSATDLTPLVWDDNLARVAQKLTKQCKIEHDKNRKIPSYGMFVGQNLAAGQRNWKKAMQSWFDEVQLYRYGENADQYLGLGGWKKIGHYTQMVQNATHRVGCGFARCARTRYGKYYACNYAQGQSSTIYPYTRGERCSACPNSCRNGLCACNGKLCLNRGELDLDTCTCKCPKLYGGDDCSILNCPASDPFYCRRSLLPDDCQVYANVPHLCPFMCGVCGEQPLPIASNLQKSNKNRPKGKTTTTTTTTTPPPFISPYNCTYKGLRSSLEECKKFGDRGSDTRACVSKGGQFGCEDCERYYNVKTDYCPVLCGLCDAPCGGKVCVNGGVLDPDACKCDCTPPYFGDTCQELKCPEKDKWHCSVLQASHCKDYINVPYDCPHLCGICA